MVEYTVVEYSMEPIAVEVEGMQQMSMVQPELLVQDYLVSLEAFRRIQLFPKQRFCCMGGEYEKGEKGGKLRYSFPTVGFCDDEDVSRSFIGWQWDPETMLWFLRAQRDAFVVVVCGGIEIIVVQETTLTRLFGRLQALGLHLDVPCESTLRTILSGTAVWKAEGCCVSVTSLVVAQSDQLCANGVHLKSAKRRGRESNRQNRPCLCGSEERGTSQINHWQCPQCAEFARCVYTLALAWPGDPNRTLYDRVCVGFQRPEESERPVIDESNTLVLAYDMYEPDSSEVDITWRFFVDMLAHKRHSIHAETINSMTDFAKTFVDLSKEQLVDSEVICQASKKAQRTQRKRHFGSL